MNSLPQLPQWAWIAIAIFVYLYLKKNGQLPTWLTPNVGSPPTPPTATPVPQVVELRHVTVPQDVATTEKAAALTETRRVGFEFDIAVTPRPKDAGP